MNKLLGIVMTAMAFSLVVTVCYLWGFWGTFDIDIMYYLGLNELLVMSAVPLLGICVMLVVCISISSVLNIDKTPDSSKSALSVILKPELIYSVSLLAIIIIVVVGGTAQWLLLAIPFALFLTTFIVANGSVFNKILENRELFYVVLIATLLPSLAFGYGKTQGLLIDTGSVYRQASINDATGQVAGQELRYIGKAGQHIFLQDEANHQIVIRSLSANQQLLLKKVNNRNVTNSVE